MNGIVHVARTVVASTCLLVVIGCDSAAEVDLPPESDSVVDGLLERVVPEEVGWSTEGLEVALIAAAPGR